MLVPKADIFGGKRKSPIAQICHLLVCHLQPTATQSHAVTSFSDTYLPNWRGTGPRPHHRPTHLHTAARCAQLHACSAPFPCAHLLGCAAAPLTARVPLTEAAGGGCSACTQEGCAFGSWHSSAPLPAFLCARLFRTPPEPQSSSRARRWEPHNIHTETQPTRGCGLVYAPMC